VSAFLPDNSTDTIPKLDDVSYLFETLALIPEQVSFDGIRKHLIGMLPEVRRERATASKEMFWSNVRDSLRELMKLGLVERAALPSRTNQLDAHRGRTFLLTEAGTKFLELERRDAWEFRDRFAQAMLIAHPYLREFYRLLGAQELFFPRIQKSEIPGDVEAWRIGPPASLEGLTDFLSKAIQQVKNTERRITCLDDRMRPYLNSAWKRLDTGQKAHTFSQAVVKTFNDVAIRVLLQVYGQRMDYVTIRSAVGLLSDFGAIWSTRSLRDRRGWTIWDTSAATIPNSLSNRSPGDEALQGGVWFTRRTPDHDVVRETLMTSFFSLPGRRGGFALIHELRADVCHRLKIHGSAFDAVLRRLHSQSLVDETYAINLDRGGGHELPPSEEPFRIDGRAFYLITLLKRE
jgi:hypothetical protein